MINSRNSSLLRVFAPIAAIRRIRRPILVLGLAALAQFTAIGSAAADSSCDPGDLCFYDYGTARWGSLSGTNSSWNFGSGNNWNSRADYFYNYGQHCSARVYFNTGFRTIALALVRGDYAYSPDTGESNNWYGCS